MKVMKMHRKAAKRTGTDDPFDDMTADMFHRSIKRHGEKAEKKEKPKPKAFRVEKRFSVLNVDSALNRRLSLGVSKSPQKSAMLQRLKETIQPTFTVSAL